jgi:hypothetical protein
LRRTTAELQYVLARNVAEDAKLVFRECPHSPGPRFTSQLIPVAGLIVIAGLVQCESFIFQYL